MNAFDFYKRGTESAMQEHLFKARKLDIGLNVHQSDGEWIDGFYAIDNVGNHIIITKSPFGVFDIDPTTLCRYSNQTDKCGAKIFEGDICYDKIRKRNVVVYCDTEKMQWMIAADWGECPIDSTTVKYLSVIGSIHTTPELVGKRGT